jgi:ankyrin repeat protein
VTDDQWPMNDDRSRWRCAFVVVAFHPQSAIFDRRSGSMDARFHPAEAVLAAGDLDGLRLLLTSDPKLTTERSTCSHPTLLQCLVLTMPPVDALEEMIDLLANHGAELTDPLVAASGIDNVQAMTKLLDLGARVDGNGGWSPLEEALYWGNEAALAVLLDRGASLRNLRTAAGLGDVDAMARCFDATGALTPEAGEVDSPFQKLPIPESDRHDPRQILNNALVFAAAWGRVEAVDFLVAHGGEVNFIPAGFDFAGTPMHYAALFGRVEMVAHLLLLGASVSIPDTKVHTLPENWAAHGGHPDLSEHLRVIREVTG